MNKILSWILAVTAVSICLFFAFQVDAATTLSKPQFFVNDTFSITGENFGPPNSATSYVCFQDTSHCVSGQNFSEHAGWSWSDTSITAQVPTAVAVTGEVFVYAQVKKEECFPQKGLCEIKTVLDERGRAAYKIIPKVFSITPAPSGKHGETITLKGTGFGDMPGEVYLDSYLAAVKQWTYGAIDITTPPQFSGSTKKVIVKSSNSLASERDYRVSAGSSNDELSYQQEYLEQIFVPEAWKISGENEVIVAVLDDGVQLDHPDLEANMWKNPKEIPGNTIDDDFNGLIDDVSGYNFLDNTTNLEPKGFHGTAVAGIIGAVRDNGVGIGGIVKKIKIMPLVVADAKGTTNSSIVERAIRYAADNGAHIINLSFSTTGENGFYPQLDVPIQYAHDKGAVVVAAAGNGDVDTGIGINVNNRPQSPVCNTKRGSIALGVAALDNTHVETQGKKLAKWSNYGNNCVSISAPGTRLTTTVPPQFHKEGKTYALESGTSFATPIVAGIAALLKATYPTMRPSEIIDRIKTSADPIDDFNPDQRGQMGGRANAYRALSVGKPKPVVESFQPASLRMGENTNVSMTILNYDPTGRIVLTPLGGGADTIIQAPSSYTGTRDTFTTPLPSALVQGIYSLRILSQSGEQVSIAPMTLEILPIIEGNPQQAQTQGEAAQPETPPPPPEITPTPSIQPEATPETAIRIPQVEKDLSVPTAQLPTKVRSAAELPRKLQNVRGRILLQVEGKGEAWYVRPDTNRRVFMGRPSDAFEIMRRHGIGITKQQLERIAIAGVAAPQKNDLAFARKQAGKIFLVIDKKGEAWYIHPKELVRYFLGRPTDAFAVMRKTGLGILNKDLALIPIE